MRIKQILFVGALVLSIKVFSQGAPNSNYINNLPDFLPPTPDASAIIKADQLNVGYTTGSPNITVPLYNLQVGPYSLPISLNYSSTGIKVDEVASSVGMGWSLNAGGVVSRVIFDSPDEYRNTSNCNLNSINPDNHDQTLYNFLKNAPDKQSDIFTFSFPGGSGKFIIGLNGLPVQLTTLNLKIEVINNSFLNGFVITTDDGTAYTFTEAEVVSNREPMGENCGKTYNQTNLKTSWFLSKIELPSKNKWIDFEYTTSNIAYESSISQTISKVTNSLQVSCNGSSSYICPIGTTSFSTCIYKQLTSAKFISKISSSDGDYIAFNYYNNRQDLQGGNQLYRIAVFNRNHVRMRIIDLECSVYGTVSSNTPAGYYLYPVCATKRMFLSSVSIKGNEINTSVSALNYSFQYNSPSSLPARLSYAQDLYGYYNGKTTNTSLIPILATNDINYGAFPPTGSSAGSVQFGDRSIDGTQSAKGLLTRINYPTGGYDLITYQPNEKDGSILTGGQRVSKVTTYTSLGAQAGEREFLYQFKDNGNSSALVLANDLIFSTVKKTYQTLCSTLPDISNPTCWNAVVTSNATNPFTVFGGQHVYYRSVLEVYKSADGDNGLTEHLYTYFAGGNLGPRTRLGNRILTTPFQVVPDIMSGENFTNIYKSNGTSYDIVKKTERSFRRESLTEYYNYVVNKNYDYPYEGNPPTEAQFLPFDMEQVYINCYTSRLEWVEETDYAANGTTTVTRTNYEYNNPSYTYPNTIKTTGSDNIEQRVERKYPPDVSATTMVNRNIISPVMEEKTYKGTGTSNLLATKTQQYKDWFNDTKVITPEWVNLTLGSNTTGQKILYYGYDNMGNPLEVAKENDAHISYLWDYGKSNVIAKATGANASDIAYTSFEADGWGNWFSGDPLKIVQDAYSPTGFKHYAASYIYLYRTGLSTSKNYMVSYWTKGSSMTVSGTQSGWPKNIKSVVLNGQTWTLYVHRTSGNSTVSVTGSGTIDELRLYPEGAQLTTFTWEPLMGITSSCDPANHLSYYEYDLMGRLSIVRNEDKYVVKKYCYNYKGQPEACDYFYNAAVTQSFTKQCPSGYVGSSYSYTVPQGRYSGQTQAEADAKAQSDLAFNGQAYANLYGTCVVNCTNCTGIDKKCINGMCETGIKIYTSSTQVHGSLWECIYHYEWSDGSWSQNYTEYSSMRCVNIE